MRVRTRRLRIMKWIGTLACVGLGAEWALSIASQHEIINWPNVVADIRDGLVEICVGRDASRRASVVRRYRKLVAAPPEPRSLGFRWPTYSSQQLPAHFDWKETYTPETGTLNVPIPAATEFLRIVRVPFWIPLIVIAVPTAYLWWRDRRFPRGRCQRCGYDLTGNVSGRCPECGTPIARATRT